jgi:hypothetical protein
LFAPSHDALKKGNAYASNRGAALLLSSGVILLLAKKAFKPEGRRFKGEDERLAAEALRLAKRKA